MDCDNIVIFWIFIIFSSQSNLFKIIIEILPQLALLNFIDNKKYISFLLVMYSSLLLFTKYRFKYIL